MTTTKNNEKPFQIDVHDLPSGFKVDIFDYNARFVTTLGWRGGDFTWRGDEYTLRGPYHDLPEYKVYRLAEVPTNVTRMGVVPG